MSLKMRAEEEGMEDRVFHHIQLKAGVIREENGIVTLEISGRNMKAQDHEVLTRLFPHLGELAYELLVKEAVLNSFKFKSE